MSVAHGDFENGSVLDLTKVGAYRVAEDPETRIWMLSWRLDDGPVHRWHPGDPDPTPLLDHVAAGGRFVGHNVSYERLLWNLVLRTREWRHWPELTIAQCDDTMARALAAHLPGKLEQLAQVLGLTEKKDDAGARLMKKMARPRKLYGPDMAQGVSAASRDGHRSEWTTRPDGGLVHWWNTPENIARLGDYCDQDVRTESAADERLPPLSDEERELWERDQRINDRGVLLDLQTAGRLVDVKGVALQRADERVALLTDGAVAKHSESGKLVSWLSSRGLPCDSIAKDEHDELLLVADLLGDAEAREVIELRAEAGKTSTAKLDTMFQVACADGRARGLFKFHGAHTGRFGGSKVQPQNLPRVDEDDELPQVMRALKIVEGFNDPDPAALHDALAREIDMPVMDLLSKMLRSMLVAPPGRALIGADFSGIEARINAWMASDERELAVFRKYDAGEGPDSYRASYSATFGVPVESVTKAQRQLVAKPQVLACGYQGSVGAFLRFLKKKADIVGVTRVVMDTSYGDDAWRKAAEQHDRLPFHNGLPRDQWIAVKVVVNGWRAAHPEITQSWWDRQDAAIEAVESPGKLVPLLNGKVNYLVADGALCVRLPSGKILRYNAPRVIEKKDDWLVDENGDAVPAGEMAEDEIAMRVSAGARLEVGRRRVQVCYQGKNQKTNNWGRQYLYGGSLCNNDVQGTARELLRFAMKNVEDAGFGLQVLHVHDEQVNEVAAHMAENAVKCYEEIVSVLPPWLAGLPLAAKAWQDRRYVK